FDQASARPLHAAHFAIRIEHGHAGLAKHLGDSRLAHADRTGEADDERVAHRLSSARNSRSPSARGGSWPKKISKAIAAWPISMESPSIVRRPRLRASLSSGVSSGWVTMSYTIVPGGVWLKS